MPPGADGCPGCSAGPGRGRSAPPGRASCRRPWRRCAPGPRRGCVGARGRGSCPGASRKGRGSSEQRDPLLFGRVEEIVRLREHAGEGKLAPRLTLTVVRRGETDRRSGLFPAVAVRRWCGACRGAAKGEVRTADERRCQLGRGGHGSVREGSGTQKKPGRRRTRASDSSAQSLKVVIAKNPVIPAGAKTAPLETGGPTGRGTDRFAPASRSTPCRRGRYGSRA